MTARKSRAVTVATDLWEPGRIGARAMHCSSLCVDMNGDDLPEIQQLTVLVYLDGVVECEDLAALLAECEGRHLEIEAIRTLPVGDDRVGSERAMQRAQTKTSVERVEPGRGAR